MTIDKMKNNEKYKISIFGSCVSRDLMEYLDRETIELKTYIARQSIVSAISKPINCCINDIDLKSNFQKMQVYGDLTKNTFELLSNDGSEFLIIDLIDERFPLIKFEGRILTYSNELALSNYVDQYTVIKRRKNNRFQFFQGGGKGYIIDNKPLKYYLDEFCDKISNLYEGKRVIIHCAKMLNYYKNRTKEKVSFPDHYLLNNKKANDLLQYMYDYIYMRIPMASVIDIADDYYADETNKWGLAPMHYQKEYYTEAGNLLLKILNN